MTGACAVWLPVVVEALDVAAPTGQPGLIGQQYSEDEGYGYEFEGDSGTSIWFHFVEGRLVELTWEVLNQHNTRVGFDPHMRRVRPGPRAPGSAKVPDAAFVGGRWETVSVNTKTGTTQLRVRFAADRLEVELEQIHIGQCDWDPPPKP